jgi:hypothetical protein
MMTPMRALRAGPSVAKEPRAVSRTPYHHENKPLRCYPERGGSAVVFRRVAIRASPVSEVEPQDGVTVGVVRVAGENNERNTSPASG